MAELVYFLCAVTSIACAVLPLRSHYNSRAQLKETPSWNG